MEDGTQLTIGPYDVVFPEDAPILGPWLHVSSDLLATTDDAVKAWRESATEAMKNMVNGFTLGALLRAREALRSCQVLAMLGQRKDSQILTRVIFEWRLTITYIWLDPTQVESRIGRLDRFQAVEKLRAFKNADAFGAVAKENQDGVGLQLEYDLVKAEFPGGLNQKKPFSSADGQPLSMAGLARECGLLKDYAAFYGHASALAHASSWSLASESGDNAVVGLMTAVVAYMGMLERCGTVLSLDLPAFEAIRTHVLTLAPE